LTYHIISLGCFKNQADSETANSYLVSYGFLPVDSPEEADIIIINTCGFIEDAKKESISVILDASDITQGDGYSSNKKLVVAGCLSQRYMCDLKKDIPEVDFFYGVIDGDFVPAMCEALSLKYLGGSAPKLLRVPLIASPYEYIKIAEGCSNNCSYCAIPLIRGKHVSYPPEQILTDVRQAIERGAMELIIIAQDTAVYNYGSDNIVTLLRKISAIAENRWIRLLYLHPDHVTDQLLELFNELPNLVPYIEIPFQHVASGIVSSMNRKGSVETYTELLNKIRRIDPRIAIRSTFIAGYPGETDEQFEELLSFVRESNIDRGGVFIYSPEENTPAAELDNIPYELKVERYNQLSEELESGFLTALERRIGETVPVLVEEQTGEESWIGRSWYDAPEVDGVFFLTGKGKLLNSIVRASVTECINFDLVGKI